jgi:hypothetical protein
MKENRVKQRLKELKVTKKGNKTLKILRNEG